MSFEDNTVNGGGDRSIQRIKLVQQVKDKTHELRVGLDLWADTRLKAGLTLGWGDDIKQKCTE